MKRGLNRSCSNQSASARDKSACGIGVEKPHGLARHRGDDVARTLSRSRRHVSASATTPTALTLLSPAARA